MNTRTERSALGQAGDAINMVLGIMMIGLFLYVAYMMAASGWQYVNKTSMSIAVVITAMHCASVIAIRRDAVTVKGIWVAAFGYFGMLTYFGIVYVMLDASPEPTTVLAKAMPKVLGMLATVSPVVVALVGLTVSWLNDLDSSSGDGDKGSRRASSFSEANTYATKTDGFQPDSRRDRFESELSSLKARRGSSVDLDFSQDRTGQYRNARTRNAFQQYASAPAHQRSNEDFMLSLMVGYATDSPFLGYAVGGSLAGGFVGASLADNSSRHTSDYTPSISSTSSFNPGDGHLPSSNYSPDFTPVVESCRASDYSSSSDPSDSSSSYSNSSSSSYESSSSSSSYASGSSSSSSSSSFD